MLACKGAGKDLGDAFCCTKSALALAPFNCRGKHMVDGRHVAPTVNLRASSCHGSTSINRLSKYKLALP